MMQAMPKIRQLFFNLWFPCPWASEPKPSRSFSCHRLQMCCGTDPCCLRVLSVQKKTTTSEKRSEVEGVQHFPQPH